MAALLTTNISGDTKQELLQHCLTYTDSSEVVAEVIQASPCHRKNFLIESNNARRKGGARTQN